MEQTADDGGKIKEQDRCNRDGDDEVEDEDDDKLSMKEKLWKFIIT